MMSNNPNQEVIERVQKEKSELDEKIHKLNAFVEDEDKFNKLAIVHRRLLIRQRNAMSEYAVILSERLESFGAYANAGSCTGACLESAN